jgi:hypothetical protein
VASARVVIEQHAIHRPSVGAETRPPPAH